MYYMVREQRQRPSLHKHTTIAFVNTLPTWYGHVNIIQPNQSSNEDGGARGAPASGALYLLLFLRNRDFSPTIKKHVLRSNDPAETAFFRMI